MVVLSVTPSEGSLTAVIITSEGLTGTPLSLSLSSTFDIAVPPLIPLAVPPSWLASIGAAVTETVTVAPSQFAGFRFSQIL